MPVIPYEGVELQNSYSAFQKALYDSGLHPSLWVVGSESRGFFAGEHAPSVSGTICAGSSAIR